MYWYIGYFYQLFNAPSDIVYTYDRSPSEILEYSTTECSTNSRAEK